MSFLLAPLGLAGKITGAATGTDPVRLGMKMAQKHPELAKKVAGKTARVGVKHVEHMGQRVVDSSEDIADISDRDSDRLRSLESLAKISGLFDTEKKQEQLTVWSGFTEEQMEALQSGKKAKLVAHGEKEDK